jgi:sulfur-carrier protein
MRVYIPGPLKSYTQERVEVELSAPSLGELLHELDRTYPGMRFRIIDEQECVRPHIKLFVNRQLAPNLSLPLAATDEIHIICALSGG